MTFWWLSQKFSQSLRPKGIFLWLIIYKKTVSKNAKNRTSLQLASCEFYENSEENLHRTRLLLERCIKENNNKEVCSEPCQTSKIKHFAKITTFNR